MRRGFALVAEVLERGDEAAAKEGLPLTVHGHAGGQWILGREEPAGEGQAVGRGVLGQARQEGGHAWLNFFARVQVFATVVAHGRPRIGGGTLAHDERGLAARDALAQGGEGLGVDGDLGRGLQEAHAQGVPVLRGGAGEHGLDRRGVTGGGGVFVGADGKTEMSERTGEVLFKKHLQRPAGRKVGRLGEPEDGRLALAVAAQHLPAAGHLAVERGGSVVLLPGGLALRLGLGRGGGVADPVFFLVVRREGVAEFQAAALMPGLELAEEEAAEGPLVAGEARAVVGQGRVVGDLEPERRDALERTIEGQVVDVALGAVASAEDEAVGLDLEFRHRGLELGGPDHFPLRGLGGFGGDPGVDLRVEGGDAAGELAGQGFFGGGDLAGVLGQLRGQVGRRDMVGRFVGVVQQRHDTVVVRVQDRIILMGVALGAVHREAHPGSPGGAHAVDHGVETVFVGVDAAFFVQHRVAVEAGGDEVVWRGAGEEVAGELLDAELVVGQVGVEGLHDPIAVRPDRARAVLLEAVGVGVAG